MGDELHASRAAAQGEVELLAQEGNDAEVEVIDQAFAKLVRVEGSNDLLRDPQLSGPLSIVKQPNKVLVNDRLQCKLIRPSNCQSSTMA